MEEIRRNYCVRLKIKDGGAELCSCCPAELVRLLHHLSEDNNHSFILYKKTQLLLIHDVDFMWRSYRNIVM